MQTVRKDACHVKVGEVIVELDFLWCVLEAGDSWDGGIAFRVLDLMDGTLSHQFFAAFDYIDVLA